MESSQTAIDIAPINLRIQKNLESAESSASRTCWRSLFLSIAVFIGAYYISLGIPLSEAKEIGLYLAAATFCILNAIFTSLTNAHIQRAIIASALDAIFDLLNKTK